REGCRHGFRVMPRTQPPAENFAIVRSPCTMGHRGVTRMPNARLAERAPFFAEVDVVAAGLPAPRRVWGTDVSETGMFLQTTQPFRIGDRVSIRFDVAEREVHVRAAEVMWVRPFEPINVDGKLP